MHQSQSLEDKLEWLQGTVSLNSKMVEAIQETIEKEPELTKVEPLPTWTESYNSRPEEQKRIEPQKPVEVKSNFGNMPPPRPPRAKTDTA